MLSDRIVLFSRALHAAGMPIGPDRVLVAIAAVEQVGVERRDDVRAALAAVMLDQREQLEWFDRLFDALWRSGSGSWPLSAAAAAAAAAPAEQPGANRLAQALGTHRLPLRSTGSARRDDDGGVHSASERLRRADFATMTPDEFRAATQLAARLESPVEPVPRRRHRRGGARRPGSRIDLRATMQRSVRTPHALLPVWSRPRVDPPTLVVLLDISGSMGRYARVLLHYVHGLMRRHRKVHVLTFGTRLTDITRCLREPDPDRALARADALVEDWSGGTRIGACLAEFNRRWARRLLAGNAALLLVSDGLDRDASGQLEREAARLARYAHRLVWLNPLLRFDGFQPRAAGVRALLPHVDRMLPVHNLASLADLGRAIARPAIAFPPHRGA